MTTGSYYERGYWQGKYERPYERRRAQIIQGIYSRIPFRDDWVALDLGAGTGFYSRMLRGRGAAVVAADVDAGAVGAVRQQGCVPLVCDGDHGRLPLKQSSCDFVNALDVLEHLAEPLLLLDEIHRILKPGGYALISTQNRNSLEGWTGRGLARLLGRTWKAWDETHTKIFSYGELLRAITGRFEVIESGGYYFGMYSVRVHPLPPVIWRLYTRLPMIRRLGFTLMVTARKRAG